MTSEESDSCSYFPQGPIYAHFQAHTFILGADSKILTRFVVQKILNFAFTAPLFTICLNALSECACLCSQHFIAPGSSSLYCVGQHHQHHSKKENWKTQGNFDTTLANSATCNCLKSCKWN